MWSSCFPFSVSKIIEEGTWIELQDLLPLLFFASLESDTSQYLLFTYRNIAKPSHLATMYRFIPNMIGKNKSVNWFFMIFFYNT